MPIAHYIIFHPDRARVNVQVTATVIENGAHQLNWRGNIWVDELVGNEDPFVFSDPWLYSYCHATQLRRQIQDGPYVREGSWLLFCSGDAGDHGNLVIDTAFLVGATRLWTPKPNLALPQEYNRHFENISSAIWRRHLRYPFHGQHDSVTHTYESKQWIDYNSNEYSLLPYDQQGQRVSIVIGALNAQVATTIQKHLPGKRPVLLSDDQITPIIQIIFQMAALRIIRDIQLVNPIGNHREKIC